MRINAWIVALVLAVTACGNDETAVNPTFVVASGCNPVGADSDCLLPFPSDYYLVKDASLPSGHRVQIPDAALMHTPDGAPIDLTALHPADGFSPGTQILALFPGGVDDSPLVTWTGDLSKSLDASSPTLLIEADTGKTVLHMAELDPRADSDTRRGLVIRPMVRLKPRTRYVVAIHGLADHDGNPVAAPEGFRRIRDGHADGTLRATAARFDKDVFPVIEQLGVERGDLDLAWDFTTASEESLTHDMLQVRQDVMQKLAATPPAITVVKVTDDPNDITARVIDATMKVPLYVDSPDPGAGLNYDTDGNVVAKGEADVPIRIVIPKSVAARQPGDPPARLLQYGHGFFGSRDEISPDPNPPATGARKDYVCQIANELGLVVVAADWWGMSKPDIDPLLDAIVNDTSHAMRFVDRLHQGMANFIALGYAAKGPIAALPELQYGGGPAYDPTTLYYYGISQGGILGGTYLALSPDIQRGVLGVGGADLSLMMFRAVPFTAFLLFIQNIAPDFLDQQKFGVMFQIPFDRADPLTYVPHLLSDPFPGAPADRRVLMQNGLGDAAVPNVGTYLEARAMGVSLLQPSPRDVYGVPHADAPFDGSAVELFDFHVDPFPGLTAKIGSDNPVHEGVRRLTAAKQQIDRFLRPGGTIEQTCDGPCDPE